MSKYNFDQTLVKRDRMSLELNVGDQVWYMHSRGSSISFSPFVVLGETKQKVRIGKLGSWIWDKHTETGHINERVFDTTLVEPHSLLLTAAGWHNQMTKEYEALRNGDYDG